MALTTVPYSSSKLSPNPRLGPLTRSGIATVLIREEDKQQKCIYYTSKILLDAETSYPSLEKPALALVSASLK
jgi:hypothetical protein